jgi:8-oxo-dGTP pyrophosphatase MutT (NUDIX family)
MSPKPPSARAEWFRKARLKAYLFVMGTRRRLTLGARIAIIDDMGRIYLIRHTYAPGWQFPGGGVEPGESAETAVARELTEESAYALTARPELVGFYFNPSLTNRDHVAFYRSRHFEVARSFAANSEIAEFGWFMPDAVPPDTAASARRRIAELFDGVAPSAEW